MMTSPVNLLVNDKELDVIIDSLGLLIMEYSENKKVYERFKDSADIAMRLRTQYKMIRGMRTRK